MENEFSKNLEEFIVARCVFALKNSKDYKKIQSSNCSQEELLDTALMIGYRQGADDVIKVLLNCSHNM